MVGVILSLIINSYVNLFVKNIYSAIVTLYFLNDYGRMSKATEIFK